MQLSPLQLATNWSLWCELMYLCSPSLTYQGQSVPANLKRYSKINSRSSYLTIDRTYLTVVFLVAEENHQNIISRSGKFIHLIAK
jgi:hypothetical protein